jgi:hypothetical protein
MQIISAVAIGKTASTAVNHITDPARPRGARCDGTLPGWYGLRRDTKRLSFF